MSQSPFPLTLRVLLVAGCGMVAACGSSRPAPSSSFPHSSVAPAEGSLKDGEGAPPPTAKEQEGDCGDDVRTFRLSAKKGVRWVAVKAKVLPVVGDQQAVVVLRESGQGDAKEFAMRADFDPATLDSGLPLRDERIKKYVFAGGKAKPTLGFTLKEIHSAKLFEIPPLGETVPVTFIGELSVGGQTSDIEIPAFVTSLAKGLRITNGSKDLTLNVREQLHLGDAVDRLMALVDTEMNDDVRIQFDWLLTNVCAPSK